MKGGDVMPKEPKSRVEETISVSAQLNSMIVNAEHLYTKAEAQLKKANDLLHERYPEVTISYCGGDGCIYLGDLLPCGKREEFYSFQSVIAKYGVR